MSDGTTPDNHSGGRHRAPRRPAGRVRARLEVIRHRIGSVLGGPGSQVAGLASRFGRIPSRLDERGRRALVAVTALFGVGVVAVAAGTAVSTGDPAAPSSAAGTTTPTGAVADRALAAERADRSQRDTPSPAPSAGDEEPGAVGKSAEPSPSPSRKAAEKAAEEPTDEPTDEPTAKAAEKPTDEPEAEPEPEPSRQPDWVNPMPEGAVTSCYGMRWGVMHAGIDLAARPGTPIRAVGAGTVVSAGWAYAGYGISVVIDHGNGFLTHYAHASQATVSVGEEVSPGQTIALEGTTGDSTGPHLHFEVHQGMWNQIEPSAWLRERGIEVGGC